ncbi:MAG: hypothetical protein H7X89_03410 [Rhizobiales bacterium]|nr:hypothetical protein [Hyphomicrobiales bacterium]
MSKRVLTLLASITVLSGAVFAGPASAETPRKSYQKLSTSGVTLKKKSGYWIECRYTGLGQVCDYVYARVKGAPGAKAKLQRIKVKDGTLKKRNDYWIECRYTGLGQVCDYVYAKPKS